jgi:hypothetical protein
MNCSTLRRNLLSRECPEALGTAEARHLADCPGCRVWHRRLVRLEQLLPLVAVPPCPVPSSLLELRPGSAGRVLVPAPPSGRSRKLEGSRQKLALAFSLAASLAVFTLGWWAWPALPPQARPVAADPYVTQRDQRVTRLATPSLRAAALADLADDFLAEVRLKGNDPARVGVLAGHFDRLVREDLFVQVQLVAPADRRAVASSLSRRLGQVESEASRLAVEWEKRHTRCVASLRRIAASAREADRKLRLLA